MKLGVLYARQNNLVRSWKLTQESVGKVLGQQPNALLPHGLPLLCRHARAQPRARVRGQLTMITLHNKTPLAPVALGHEKVDGNVLALVEQLHTSKQIDKDVNICKRVTSSACHNRYITSIQQSS
jgi:hypothetical protein